MQTQTVLSDTVFEARLTDRLSFSDNSAFRKLLDDVVASKRRHLVLNVAGLTSVDFGRARHVHHRRRYGEKSRAFPHPARRVRPRPQAHRAVEARQADFGRILRLRLEATCSVAPAQSLFLRLTAMPMSVAGKMSPTPTFWWSMMTRTSCSLMAAELRDSGYDNIETVSSGRGRTGDHPVGPARAHHLQHDDVDHDRIRAVPGAPGRPGDTHHPSARADRQRRSRAAGRSLRQRRHRPFCQALSRERASVPGSHPPGARPSAGAPQRVSRAFRRRSLSGRRNAGCAAARSGAPRATARCPAA